MTMTDQEIVREYREAKTPLKQIGILADENQCSRAQIVDILLEAGMELPAGYWEKAGAGERPVGTKAPSVSFADSSLPEGAKDGDANGDEEAAYGPILPDRGGTRHSAGRRCGKRARVRKGTKMKYIVKVIDTETGETVEYDGRLAEFETNGCLILCQDGERKDEELLACVRFGIPSFVEDREWAISQLIINLVQFCADVVEGPDADGFLKVRINKDLMDYAAIGLATELGRRMDEDEAMMILDDMKKTVRVSKPLYGLFNLLTGALEHED